MPNPTVEVKFELFDLITSGIKNINDAMGGFKKSMAQLSNYIDETGKKFFFMNQLAEGMDRFNQSVKQFAAPGADFQQQMADLSAITGMVGTDLEKISASSRQVGKETGLGASAAAEAYKLLASNIDWTKIGIEGLQQLQKDTVTLTQASGIDMATAADVMAGAINQFGYKATESTRIINVLGAGAKFGAAEIADLGASLKVSGTTASLAGISIEGATGAIEVMSQSMIKGEQAGTYLRNIILKLQTENIPGIDLKTQGLSGSLEALKPKLNDVTWLTKTFGMENVNAAQILISQSDAVKEMTDRVTGTNTAMEQAKTRTNTYNYAMMRVKASIDDMKISLFNATGSMLPWVEVLSQGVSGIARTLPGLKVMKDGLLYVGGILKTGAVGFAKYISSLNMTRTALQTTTVAQRVLNAVMKANPYILLISAVVALGASLYVLSKKMNAVAVAQRTINDVKAEALKNVIDEKLQTERLIGTARNLNLSYSEREAALNQLKEKNAEYFGQLTMETVQTEAADVALKKYIASMLKEAVMKGMADAIAENAKKQIDAATGNADFNFWEKLAIWNSTITTGMDYEDAKMVASLKELMPQQKLLEEYYANMAKQIAEQEQGNVESPNFKDKKFGKKLFFPTNFNTNPGNKPPKTLKTPEDKINEVSGKASVKNIYINMEAGLKIGTISHQGEEDMDTFISKMRTALNLVLNDANYLAG